MMHHLVRRKRINLFIETIFDRKLKKGCDSDENYRHHGQMMFSCKNKCAVCRFSTAHGG